MTRGTQWHRTYWRSSPAGIKREQVSPVKLCPCPHPGTAENIIKHAPRAQRSLLAVNDTATKNLSEPVRRSTVSLAFFPSASGDRYAWRGGFDVVRRGNSLFKKKKKGLGKHRCMSINMGRIKRFDCAHMTDKGFGSLKLMFMSEITFEAFRSIIG